MWLTPLQGIKCLRVENHNTTLSRFSFAGWGWEWENALFRWEWRESATSRIGRRCDVDVGRRLRQWRPRILCIGALFRAPSLSLALWLSPNVRPPRVHSGCCSTFVVVSIFLFALVGFVFVGVFLSLSGFFWYALEQQPENLIDS